MSSIPKIIAGVTPACTEMASLLYGGAMKQVITVSSTPWNLSLSTGLLWRSAISR